jgi:hypothetical protein
VCAWAAASLPLAERWPRRCWHRRRLHGWVTSRRALSGVSLTGANAAAKVRAPTAHIIVSANRPTPFNAFVSAWKRLSGSMQPHRTLRRRRRHC